MSYPYVVFCRRPWHGSCSLFDQALSYLYCFDQYLGETLILVEAGRNVMAYKRRLRLDNILVIDDDLQVLDSIRCFLQHVGYEVATASSGQEGSSLIDSGY